ncbi:protein-disulfide reductase DsbD N-terminal domain-containing protein (plasmid) [Burkholderia thailandensis]|nr:protein-disulfide reductase DsbD N-terminal domain-containing protein [Burkholderia thailandensis]QRA15401.1 protein-disulfide reductase DsbD N-terminal domain-containing protein [Burkholderia thailandensis]
MVCRWMLILVAAVTAGAGVAHAADFLPPDQAFRVRMTEEPGAVVFHFAVAEGYHLYRDRFRVTADDGQVTVGALQVPRGQVMHDPVIGRTVEIYQHEVAVRAAIRNAHDMFEITIEYQGCAEAGLCYPPTRRTFPVIAGALSAADGASHSGSSATVPPSTPAARLRASFTTDVFATASGAAVFSLGAIVWRAWRGGRRGA